MAGLAQIMTKTTSPATREVTSAQNDCLLAGRVLALRRHCLMVGFRGLYVMVELSKNAALDIQKFAVEQYPKEACGVIVSIGKKFVVINCKNISYDPKLHFVIDPADYVRAEEMGEVIAIWHTHVDESPEPSLADRAGCNLTELPWIIVSIIKNEDGFSYSEPVHLLPDGTQASYLERPYLPGVFDCYTLIRDYYKNEFGITLGSYTLDINEKQLWNPGHTYFVDNFEKEGFFQVFDEEPKRGDCFLMQSSASAPDHAMLYIGDGLILHHVYGRLSGRAVYGGYWSKHTTHHLRHSKL